MNKHLMYLLLLASVVQAAQPNFTGKWKLNETQTPPRISGPHDIVFDIKHDEPHFRYRATGVMAISTPFSEAVEFTTDGKSVPDPAKLGGVGHWEGAALVMQYMKDGKPIARVTLRLSPDGKRMMRDTAFPGRPLMHEVYDRQ